LKALGFEFDRQAAGSHEIWFNASAWLYTTIPNHPGDMPEGTLRAIVRQAEIAVDDFWQPDSAWPSSRRAGPPSVSMQKRD
jgi:predicted RNA binding protein YcfA (HicA-like mRNA interferase family)